MTRPSYKVVLTINDNLIRLNQLENVLQANLVNWSNPHDQYKIDSLQEEIAMLKNDIHNEYLVSIS